MPHCRVEYISQKAVFAATDGVHPVLMHQLAVDPYAGCSLGCQYCRCLKNEKIDYKDKSAKSYVGVKTDLLYNLNKFISGSGQAVNILLGAETEPYQPLEEVHMITRVIIETLLPAKWPLVIFTKSDLILRDVSLLEEYNKNASLAVVVSFLSLDDNLSSQWEGNIIKPKKRLEIIEKLSVRNIACGAALMPIIPDVNDDKKKLKDFFCAAKKAGSEFILPGMLELDRKKNNNAVERILGLKQKLSFLVEGIYGAASFPNEEYRKTLAEELVCLSNKYKIRLCIAADGTFSDGDLAVKYD